MGLSIEFYAGDPAKIGPAFTEIELDALRDGTLAHGYADFSLHLSPDDLDVLSEQIGVMLNRPPILLLDFLAQSIGGTPHESEAYTVSRVWVEMVAKVPLEQAVQLARNWLESAANKRGEKYVTDSPESVTAVAALIHLCRESLARRTEVIFAWYL